MSALILALIAATLGLGIGKPVLESFLTEPRTAKLMEQAAGKRFGRETEAMTMLSTKALAREKRLLEQQKALGRTQHSRGIEAMLLQMMGQQAMGAQSSAAAGMQALGGGLGRSIPPPMPPGAGIVSSIRGR